ncbi:MAG: hypothetical protein HQL56_07685 [Magnetococcales bacterium]|nr:hypothetical protein [Magnetococcales bacterium]
MRRRVIGFLVIMLQFVANYGYADYFIDLLSITCIPQSRYFRVEHLSVTNDQLYSMGEDRDDIQADALLREWAKQGLYHPNHLNYRCNYPGGAYEVVSSFLCPADQICRRDVPAQITLKHKERVVLDKVSFGRYGFEKSYIETFEITEKVAGYGVSPIINACFSTKEDNDIRFCEMLYGQSHLFPWTSQNIESFVTSYLNSKGKNDRREIPQFIEFVKIEKNKSCRFPGKNIPEDAVLFGGMGVMPGSTFKEIGPKGEKVVEVIVNVPEKPVVIVLTAYERTIWKFKWTPASRIAAVVATGFEPPLVEGLPLKVPVLLSSFKEGGECGYIAKDVMPLNLDPASNEDTFFIKSRLANTGKTPDEIQQSHANFIKGMRIKQEKGIIAESADKIFHKPVGRYYYANNDTLLIEETTAAETPMKSLPKDNQPVPNRDTP